tara:strand:- start:9927 stop:10451 length:525 start_codon:yes stop_codon:yes gene_type:complete
MGHPLLRQAAENVAYDEIKSEEFSQLIRDMYDTMKQEGGIGIAAPQIGVSKQVAIIELPEDSERYEEVEKTPLLVIINPVLTVLDNEKKGYWEGCLSVPGLRGYVERPQKIKVEFTDLDLKKQTLELDGFLATVFQHELDHLSGTLYVDKIKDTKHLSYEEEFIQFFRDEDTLE